jgi:hypothetical protein
MVDVLDELHGLFRRDRSDGVVGDSHKGPLITSQKPICSQNNKNTNELTDSKSHLMQPRPG